MIPVRALKRIELTNNPQSTLIHSAAGGVGIACIQLAQYIGAEVCSSLSYPARQSRAIIHGLLTTRIRYT